MKLAIYQKDGSYATVLDSLENVKLLGDEILFNGGSISGINQQHILLDDETPLPETLEEAKLLDKKLQFTEVKVDEVADLKAQLQAAREENEMNALAIMELAELVLGG